MNVIARKFAVFAGRFTSFDDKIVSEGERFHREILSVKFVNFNAALFAGCFRAAVVGFLFKTGHKRLDFIQIVLRNAYAEQIFFYSLGKSRNFAFHIVLFDVIDQPSPGDVIAAVVLINAAVVIAAARILAPETFALSSE